MTISMTAASSTVPEMFRGTEMNGLKSDRKMTDEKPPALSGRTNFQGLSKLVGTSDEAQTARLSELKGRWVAIITSGFELTKCCQYETMQKLGMKLFLVEDEKNPVALKLHSDGIATHVPVDLTPTADLVQRVVESLTEATTLAWQQGERPNMDSFESPGMLAACWTIWDDGVCLASRVQQYLGLRGDVPEVIDVCHDKYLSRKRLEENGVDGPKSLRIANQEDAISLGSQLRYPIVLKPVNGAASIGVYFVDSHEELKAKFDQCQEHLRAIYQDSELMGLVFDDSLGVQDSDGLLAFCAEEFIGGPEFDVDVILIDGECVYSNIGQDWKYKEGWMCERGMHHPAQLDKDMYQLISTSAASFARTLGCTTGVFHVEMKLDPVLGPQMIECNPRMGGGPVFEFHRLAWGVDLIAEAAMAFLGIPCRPKVPEQPLGTAISLLLFSDKCGILAEPFESRNQEIIHHPRTTFFCMPGEKGDEVRGWQGEKYPSHLGRVDFFIARSGDEGDAAGLKWAFEQRARVCIPLESGDHYDNTRDVS